MENMKITQVYDIDVFYNGNLIVAGFFSSVTSVVKELINEVYNFTHLYFLSVCASSLTLPQVAFKKMIYSQSVK